MTNKEKLIEKLYQGSCSREELELLLDLIQDDTEEDYSDVMARLWRELSTYPEMDKPMASEMTAALFNRIDIQQPATPLRSITPKSKTSSRPGRRRFIRIASAAAILLLIGIISWQWLGTAKLIIAKTAYAEQKTVVLPDGSIVKLNANSTLNYHKTWDSQETRRVWLDGEAYFEVSKRQQTGQKFQVITRDLTVEVLGTVFNVNTRETATEVFLEEGKVSLDLEQASEDILMVPGELVTYSKSSGKPTKKQIENEAPASWKDGTAILRDALLKDIIQKVEELYEVEIAVTNKSDLEREFSIFLPVDNSELAFLMLEGLGLEIEKGDKVWTIK